MINRLLSKSYVKISICLLFIVLMSVMVFYSGAYSVYCFQTQKKVPIYSVGTDEKKISISFDCAWGVDYTDKLLEEMKKYNVRCTFFMVEFWTTKYPEYVKKINDNGHEIGTHSATHKYMSKLNEKEIREELSTSSKAIEEIIGKKVEVFRPPYGDYNNLLIDTAMDMGLYSIQWDVDSLDWKNLSAEEITRRVTSKVQNGSIILCHNNGLHTAEALPLIFEKLCGEGYQFVPVGELIYKDNYSVDSNGRQIKI